MGKGKTVCSMRVARDYPPVEDQTSKNHYWILKDFFQYDTDFGGQGKRHELGKVSGRGDGKNDKNTLHKTPEELCFKGSSLGMISILVNTRANTGWGVAI